MTNKEDYKKLVLTRDFDVDEHLIYIEVSEEELPASDSFEDFLPSITPEGYEFFTASVDAHSIRFFFKNIVPVRATLYRGKRFEDSYFFPGEPIDELKIDSQIKIKLVIPRKN